MDKVRFRVYNKKVGGYENGMRLVVTSDGLFEGGYSLNVLSPYLIELNSGYVDSDGVKCYAGDIITSSFGNPPVPIEAEVVYEEGCFSVKVLGDNDIQPKRLPLSLFKIYLGDFWVRGTIHD